jgi:hypothetical protein
MTFLIAFPLIAGSLAVLLLLSGRATRHPARNEEALIPAPIPGLLVPPGVCRSFTSVAIKLRGLRTLCQRRRSTGGSNRT